MMKKKTKKKENEKTSTERPGERMGIKKDKMRKM